MQAPVARPLWRGFAPGDPLADAVTHVTRGGIAVIYGKQHWRLWGRAPGPAGTPLPEMVDWAIRAVEAVRFKRLAPELVEATVEAVIPPSWHDRVEEWIVRDLPFDGATALTHFDCMKCGACCFDNRVELEAPDLARFKAAGRDDLLRRVSRQKGKLLLPLAPTKDKPCVHLKQLKCTIYDVRPHLCRDFPVGTENCLSSREELYGTPFPQGR